MVLDGLTVRLDGQPAASTVVNRKRMILNATIEYAVELGFLKENPIPALKWKAPLVAHQVDRRAVANPVQARTVFAAVASQKQSGPRLVAFYACMYFAALRPEEAASLRRGDLELPDKGWGELRLSQAEPYAGKDWTDTGGNRDRRQLKHRARGTVRPVPCPPELTAILHEHIKVHGTAPDGRLFYSRRNHGELPKVTISRVWKRAREEAFIPEVADGPLARTPYDLRHAAVSTWLSAGVPPTDVAEWAGQSVEVLLRIYAKSLDGGDEELRKRVEKRLGHGQ